MGILAFKVVPLLDQRPGWALASSVGFLGSLGLYRVLAVALTVLANKWTWLLRLVLGPRFLRGTWIGRLRTKTGQPRLVVEHYDQTLSSLVIRGQSFLTSRELDATWYTHAAQIDEHSGVLYCFYSSNVLAKHYPVEGIGCLTFDRADSGMAPTGMSGYSIDSDAGLDLPEEKRNMIKMIYERLSKESDDLITFDEAKRRLFNKYGERDPPGDQERVGAGVDAVREKTA
jgi:hypothetical protein